MSYTITKIRCPSCVGTGECPMLGFTCTWCRGSKRLPRAKALNHANVVYTLAGGGYIAGEYSLQEMRERERSAEAVYAVFRETPPWRQTREPSDAR